MLAAALVEVGVLATIERSAAVVLWIVDILRI